MKNENPTELYGKKNETPIHPALTNALRAAIVAGNLQGVFETAGAKKFRGTPIEVLEEVAAAQTAAWIVGFESGPMAAPVPAIRLPEVAAVAEEAIDSEALKEAAELIGIQGDPELDMIRTHLTSTLALVAFEANRVALAEGRPVCHNCVAVGGVAVVRNAFLQRVEENPQLEATQ